MEALEAQRYLQTTLPRFLENIDDAYKVPFNFKVRPQASLFMVAWWWLVLLMVVVTMMVHHDVVVWCGVVWCGVVWCGGAARGG
jgi:hypothetical protein